MNRTLLALMLAVCSAVSAQPPSYVPSDGLVGWYPLDNDGVDISNSYNTLEVYGATPVSNRFGQSLSALHFSESATLSNEGFQGIGENSAHTIAFWERHDTIHNGVILCQLTTTDTDGQKLHYGFRGVGDGICVDGGCMGMDFYNVQHFQPQTASLDVWSYWALTYDPETLNSQIYHNGQLVSEQLMPSQWEGDFNNGIVVGGYFNAGGGSGSNFNGQLDELGIWNRVLSQIEIQTLFASTPSGCTNDQACNYDTSAIEDDGSCVYPPSLDLGEDIETCEDSVTLDAGEGFGSYLWSTGDTARNIQVQESGIYGVEVFEGYENLRSVHLNAPTVLESSQEDLIHDIFSGTHPFSISLWVKSDDYTNGQICDKGYINSASESNASSMQVFVGGNGLSFQVYSDGDNWLSVTTDSDHVPEEGQWSHIVCCYDGGVDFSSMSIFINGELIDTSGDQVQEGNFDGLHSNTEPLHFGARVSAGGSYAYPLSGLLDDITVFDQALIAPQVVDLFTCGSCLNPAFHWGFEDPQHVVGELISGHFQSTGQGTSTLYSPSFSGNALVSSSNEVRSIHPDCLSSDSISVFLVPCGDLSSLCGEGTVWDEYLQECISLCETESDNAACGEGTVWDPINQECIVAIPTDTDFDGCVAAGDLLNLLGTFGSCPPIPFSGPCQGQDHVTYQGYDYDIVAIGEQCWFAENLRFLPTINAPSDRSNDTPKYYIWQYNGADLEEGLNTLEYLERGALYNQPAAIDGCPTGWHLPSKEEMDALSAFAGGDAVAGMALKSEAMGGTNELGFDLDFTGYLNDEGLWAAETRANLWSASPDPANSENGLYRFVHQNFDSFEETGNRKRAGKGVRCIKDQ